MKKYTVFTRDFTWMIIGQIISLFGNSIVRFALSLQVLEMTGSAASFAMITGASMVLTILLSPLGGLIADRMSKRDIMAGLDFLTCGICIAFHVISSGRDGDCRDDDGTCRHSVFLSACGAGQHSAFGCG